MTREEIIEIVNTFLIEEIEIEKDAIKDDARLIEDLGIDSLDFVNVLNRFTGVQKQHIRVATAPSWFALGNDGKLYVSLYDTHISFSVTR